jgi:hypothetical protein
MPNSDALRLFSQEIFTSSTLRPQITHLTSPSASSPVRPTLSRAQYARAS